MLEKKMVSSFFLKYFYLIFLEEMFFCRNFTTKFGESVFYERLFMDLL